MSHSSFARLDSPFDFAQGRLGRLAKTSGADPSRNICRCICDPTAPGSGAVTLFTWSWRLPDWLRVVGGQSDGGVDHGGSAAIEDGAAAENAVAIGAAGSG